jgi:hypothetical protein
MRAVKPPEHESSHTNLLRPCQVCRRETTPSARGATVDKAIWESVVCSGTNGRMPGVCEVVRVRGDTVQLEGPSERDVADVVGC